MATIYSAPKHIKLPEFNLEGTYRDYEKECDAYLETLKEEIRKNNPTEYIGETIRFQVADGYAVYMVANLKPVKLIHIEIGDAWHFELAHKLNKKDVIGYIQSEKRMKEIFGDSKK